MEKDQQMQAQEGTYTFYKDDRERIKGRSMLPTETLRYIEALEAVAHAGYEAWKHTNATNKPGELTVPMPYLDTLYDALSVVNFMSDEP